MIQKAIGIMDKNFMVIDVLNSVRRIQNIFLEKNIEYFIVEENKNMVGIITKKELVGVHPNRIIADAMSKIYKCIDCSTSIWQIKDIYDFDKEIDVMFIEEERKIMGFVTRTILNIELGKHIDVLTGLYKSEYLFYNIYNLIISRKTVSIIFIDLNNFGKLNKMYGHVDGDLILKNIAEILRESINVDTYLCRYAGDEFAVLTPYCIDECRLLAVKLRDIIKLHEFPNNISVTVSIGITCSDANCKIDNVPALIHRLINIASLASTKAKENIDNLIVIEDIDINAIA